MDALGKTNSEMNFAFSNVLYIFEEQTIFTRLEFKSLIKDIKEVLTEVQIQSLVPTFQISYFSNLLLLNKVNK